MESGKNERSVELQGRAKQRRKALKLIMKVATFVREDSGSVLVGGPAGGRGASGDSGSVITDALPVAPNEVGKVLGRGGETIRRVEDETGARLELDRQEGRLSIRGSQAAVARAKGMIIAEVRGDAPAFGTPPPPFGAPPPLFTMPPPPCGAPPPCSVPPPQGPPTMFKIWVQSKEAGRVIGKGGESVRELMSRTGCEITVERSDGSEPSESERLITLSGMLPQISDAFTIIARDVSYLRGEAGVIKSPEMSPHEADAALRTYGPASLAMIPVGMMPPMMAMRPSMPPPPPGMPPGIGPLTGMPPPPAGLPPGVSPMPGPPMFPGALPSDGSSTTAAPEVLADGQSFAAPWNASRPIDDWDEL